MQHHAYSLLGIAAADVTFSLTGIAMETNIRRQKEFSCDELSRVTIGSFENTSTFH